MTRVEPEVTSGVMREAQLEDPSMAWVIRARENGTSRPDWETVSDKSVAAKTYWSHWDQLQVKNAVLCFKWESDEGKKTQWKTVIPKSQRKAVVEELHGGKMSGHLGFKRTFARVRSLYYWSGMRADVRSYIRECERCAKRKSPPKKNRATLQQRRIGFPMERVALDIIGPLPETEAGNRWILVVGDYFTKWTEAYPLVDTRAETVAETLVTEFICRFGVPAELHSDQGRNFE